MRKKLLSMLLVLSVALTLVPFSVLAEESPGSDGSSDAVSGLQGKVEKLTPNLTETKTETRTDDTSGKSASVIEVSVAPDAVVPFSPKDEKIGRDRDGWWVGVKIVAPKNVTLDTLDGTGSNGAVLFRNNGDNADRVWKEPIVDGGNGTDANPYYMGAWIGPSLENLAAGKTSYSATWYFNWDGSSDTGITVKAEEFTGVTGASDMAGVDQIIKVTFELKDGVQLAGKEGSDGLAWPINVTFETGEGGSKVAAQKLGLGGKVAEPAEPKKGGYTFDGWYKEAACENEWDFANDTVSKDTTIYAKWKQNTNPDPTPDNPEYVRVTFGKLTKMPSIVDDQKITLADLGDFTIPAEANSSRTLTVSGTASYISEWEKFNSTVEKEQSGHYLPIQILLPNNLDSYGTLTITGAGDENPKVITGFTASDHGVELVIRLDDLTGKKFTVQYDSEPAYTIDCSGITLKSETVETVKYKVAFDTDGGSSVPDQEVEENKTATRPAEPTKSGYTFGGWYKEKECKTVWDFDKDTVTGNLTLYAKWTEKTGGDGTDEDREYEISVRSGIRYGSVDVSHWYAEPGMRVTITVDPESDYVVDWVEAVRESSGRTLSLTRNGRRYTFTMPASDVAIDASFRLQYAYTYTYFEPAEPTQPAVFTPAFTPAVSRTAAVMRDVPTYSWAYSSAQWAYQNGYLDLAADGTFRLDGPVSHRQMWRIMAQWLGEPNMSDQELTNWAMQNGAAKGSPASSAMTRQDVVVYLYQCCFLMGGDVSADGNLASYADSRLITAASVRNAWTWAVGKGIISGTADGYLHPGSAVNRGEFAAILMRLCQNA